VDTNHSYIAQRFEEKMNNMLKGIKEKQMSKKRTNPSGRSISKFFLIKDFKKKRDVP
jgi:hypothetical protein